MACLACCVDLIDESKQNARLHPGRCFSYASHASDCSLVVKVSNQERRKSVITRHVCVQNTLLHLRGCYFGLMECPAFCEKGAINRPNADGR